MADQILWECDTPINDLGWEEIVPLWIDQQITPADVAAIEEGGCASGAYMPAVTYCQAVATMSEYGDDVLEFIEDRLGELPQPGPGTSWSGLACFYLSHAIELWAHSVDMDLACWLEEHGEEEEPSDVEEEPADYRDYRHIGAWGAYMGSHTYYVHSQQAQAARDGAPLDAIYQDHTGAWRCFSDTKPGTPAHQYVTAWLAGREEVQL